MSKKILLTHRDVPTEKHIGYETRYIESGMPKADEILIILAREGDYGVLMRAKEINAKVTYKVKGSNVISEYTGELTADLEQFCRVKHKTDLTLDKVKAWFDKCGFILGPPQHTVKALLDDEEMTTENLERTYNNICIGLGIDPKPFRKAESNIDTFNTRLAYTHNDRADRQYMGDNVRKLYNWKGEYEEHPIEDTVYERKLSSYRAECKKTYNIITPRELCTILAYAPYINYTELPDDVYMCKCGAYVKYRTVQVQQDPNTGYWKTYPDTKDPCCPKCGTLRKHIEEKY